MTAFDQAWALLKMPIVPGSVRRNYRAEEEDEERRFLGEFDDPKTQERLTMDATMQPDGDLSVEILGQEDDTYKIHPRARAYFMEMGRNTYLPREDSWRDEEGRKFIGVGVNTDDEYQRRGYASALYDLASYILDRRDGGNRAVLVPSSDQTRDGESLWDKTWEDVDSWAHLPVDGGPRWRLRGDLG